MLPKRISTPKNRTARWISPAHCNFVRKHHCCVNGCADMPIEVAHVRTGTDGGMGKKPSDYWAISLCKHHHAEQHRIGEPAFEKRHGIDMKGLATEFASASPKAREIKMLMEHSA